jgi:predicted phosphodiesterase
VTTWGLVADVHGNLGALETALDVLRAAGAQRFAFLGDYLGRGDSDGCVRRIREVADIAILGNRDLDWQDRVSPETRAWVISLPRWAHCNGLLVAHGDARLTRGLSTAQVRRDFIDAWGQLQQSRARVFAFGHSHHARVWRKASAEAPSELLTSDRVLLEPAYRYFVNVGSVGLPFPGKGGPSVSVLDLAAGWLAMLPLTGRGLG